ncbi:hypothetical protein VCHA30O60_50130 [Vibrio chagasii]|nr:hypothetical protein VCHA30O60_50130 [Vibrio chagasii]
MNSDKYVNIVSVAFSDGGAGAGASSAEFNMILGKDDFGRVGFGGNYGGISPTDFEGAQITALTTSTSGSSVVLTVSDSIALGSRVLFSHDAGSFYFEQVSMNEYLNQSPELVELFLSSYEQDLQFSLDLVELVPANITVEPQDQRTPEGSDSVFTIEITHNELNVPLFVHRQVKQDDGEWETVSSDEFIYDGEPLQDSLTVQNIPHPDDASINVRWAINAYMDNDYLQILSREAFIESIPLSNLLLLVGAFESGDAGYTVGQVGDLIPRLIDRENVDVLRTTNEQADCMLIFEEPSQPFFEVNLYSQQHQHHVFQLEDTVYMNRDTDLIELFLNSVGGQLRFYASSELKEPAVIVTDIVGGQIDAGEHIFNVEFSHSHEDIPITCMLQKRSEQEPEWTTEYRDTIVNGGGVISYDMPAEIPHPGVETSLEYRVVIRAYHDNDLSEVVGTPVAVESMALWTINFDGESFMRMENVVYSTEGNFILSVNALFTPVQDEALVLASTAWGASPPSVGQGDGVVDCADGISDACLVWRTSSATETLSADDTEHETLSFLANYSYSRESEDTVLYRVEDMDGQQIHEARLPLRETQFDGGTHVMFIGRGISGRELCHMNGFITEFTFSSDNPDLDFQLDLTQRSSSRPTNREIIAGDHVFLYFGNEDAWVPYIES